MKKFLSILFAVVICVPIAILAASCGGDKTSTSNLKSLSLDTANVRTTYFVGEDFSSDGLVVTGVYDDESKKVLEEKDYSINSSAFKKQVGSYEIVVSAGEISAKYSVEVKSDLDFAKMCLDNWSENANWVKNALRVESYLDNGQEIAKLVDYCDENSLYYLVKDDSVDKKVSEEIGDCGERWITPDFVGYFLSENTKTKKAYNSMLEAITDTELGLDLQSFRATVDSYIKQTFDLCVSMQDPDFVFSEERYPDLGPIEIEVGIKYYFTDTELQITFYEETGNSRNVYIFDRDTLQLKCNAMLHGDACIDSLPNSYCNSYFYFNTTPTERMTTPPTDVQWTELD